MTGFGWTPFGPGIPDDPGPEPPPPADNPLDYQQAAALSRSLVALIDAARYAIRSGPPSAVMGEISDHLQIDANEATVVGRNWAPWEHVSVHRAVAAYLTAASPESNWFGLPGTNMRMHNDLQTLLRMNPSSRLSSADYVLLPCSPDASEEVVSFGLVKTVAPDGRPVVLALRLAQQNGPPQVGVEVLAADRVSASVLLERLQELVAEHDVLRGQVLSFSMSEHMGNQLVSFLPRPDVAAQDVILPAAVLPAIEKHVAGPAEQAERLRALGIHLKRGLLLHGPPVITGS